MTSKAPYALIVLFAVVLGGCRQADGPIPTPNPTVQEELEDVRHDLEYIASGGDPEAPKYLTDDLRRYVHRSTAFSTVDELSRRTTTAVAGSPLTAQAAQRLALNLWLSVASLENSERQIESMQNDMQALLMSVGIAEDKAQQVAAQVGEVQRAVTDRPRRWYELF